MREPEISPFLLQVLSAGSPQALVFVGASISSPGVVLLGFGVQLFRRQQPPAPDRRWETLSFSCASARHHLIPCNLLSNTFSRTVLLSSDFSVLLEAWKSHTCTLFFFFFMSHLLSVSPFPVPPIVLYYLFPIPLCVFIPILCLLKTSLPAQKPVFEFKWGLRKLGEPKAALQHTLAHL